MTFTAYHLAIDAVQATAGRFVPGRAEKEMAEGSWTVREARRAFSGLIDAAGRGEPQVVTKRGKPAAVVVAFEHYARLRALERRAAPSFVDHLLAMPTDGGVFER